MTPEEKANELIHKFCRAHSNKMSDYSVIYYATAKVCALIAVDEIIDESHDYVEHHEYHHNLKYWQEVKKEIENL